MVRITEWRRCVAFGSLESDLIPTRSSTDKFVDLITLIWGIFLRSVTDHNVTIVRCSGTNPEPLHFALRVHFSIFIVFFIRSVQSPN